MPGAQPIHSGPVRGQFLPSLPLLDLLPEAFIYAKDAEHRFVFANAALWKLHGCSGEASMLGRTDFDFHPPALAEQYRREDRKVLESGQPILNEIWLVPHADGAPNWYASSKLPILDQSGTTIGVAGVMRPCAGSGEAPGDYRRLMPVIDYARTHFGEPLGISGLAARAGLSISQFQRTFRRVFGMTPSQCLLQIRLQAARNFLQHSRQPISLIALECGFHDQSHFTKRFTAATGLGPHAYRKRFALEPSSGRAQPVWPPLPA